MPSYTSLRIKAYEPTSLNDIPFVNPKKLLPSPVEVFQPLPDESVSTARPPIPPTNINPCEPPEPLRAISATTTGPIVSKTPPEITISGACASAVNAPPVNVCCGAKSVPSSGVKVPPTILPVCASATVLSPVAISIDIQFNAGVVRGKL